MREDRFSGSGNDDSKNCNEGQRILREFGVSSNTTPLNDNRPQELMNAINRAVAEHDEVTLSRRIDEARCLGRAFEWQYELEQAESALLEMTCGDSCN